MSWQRAALLAVAVVWLFIALRTGNEGRPEVRAAALVPAEALVYVHLSTDSDREQDRRALDLLGRFDAFAAVREQLEEARPWLGDEAAVAVLANGETLVLLAADDDEKARAYAERSGGVLVDGFVALGAEPVDDGERALADLDLYVDATEVRSPERALDVWVGERGAGGVLSPGLAALVGPEPVVAEVTATDGGVRVNARQLGGASESADFAPELLDGAPRDAFAYLGFRGLASLAPLLPEATGAAAPEVTSALGPLLDALDGEIALTVAPTEGDAAVTLLARPDDPAAARTALAGLQGVIATALTGSAEATGQMPVFVERDLGDGLSGFALTLAGGGELVYAVDGERIAVSNSDDGVRRGLRGEDSLKDAEGFAKAVTGVPDTAQALAFVAANQLLELADAVGLDASAAYRAARPDLSEIGALGAVMRRQGDDTTVELNLLFP